MPSETFALVAVNVGNTAVSMGAFASIAKGTAPDAVERHPASNPGACAEAIVRLAREHLADAERSAIVVASVNEKVSEAIIGQVGPRSAERVYRIGRDVPVPIGHALPHESLTGVDRLLDALAAWDMLGQACIVVDAGTAITVDFVDGEGVFQGGAIAPGLRMALRALHDRTAALPEVEPAEPDGEAFGKTTTQAMLNGVFYGARGLVRLLAERYAEAYEAYPPIVACGGDAQLLFAGDELIDRIVPDLTLRGIAVTCRMAMGDSRDEAPGARETGGADTEEEDA